jgi:thiol-disulfide isomerase/thioredoxin
MTNVYKTFLFTAAIAALSACSQAPSTEAPKQMAEKMKDAAPMAASMAAKTAGVLIYADWCGSCKVLDPKIQKVQSMGDMPGLKFVTLDYSDKDADAFYAQAEAAGVGDAVKSYLDGTIKTGQFLLVDLDDQKVLSKVTKTFEPAEIMTALKDAISAS